MSPVTNLDTDAKCAEWMRNYIIFFTKKNSKKYYLVITKLDLLEKQMYSELFNKLRSFRYSYQTHSEIFQTITQLDEITIKTINKAL